ncbi:MAG: GRAM domain-containing protein [Sporomusaceae bacterium]|nr:GRAM domain-containing protein [Sporomusaceae bacterium]
MYSFKLLEGEKVVKKGLGNLTIEDSVLNGAMYLTTERLVFVGYLLENAENKFSTDLSLYHIAELQKEKTFYIIPNVLVIRSIQDVVWRVGIGKRDSWYDAIEAAIQQTEQQA